MLMVDVWNFHISSMLFQNLFVSTFNLRKLVWKNISKNIRGNKSPLEKVIYLHELH